MGQKKLVRFAELETFRNVLQYPEGMKGKWQAFFGNEHPLTLELACGKGEYALGLGRLYRGNNYIGVDVKGNRIWRGAKTALDEGLSNVAFLRTQITMLEDYFAPGEISDIWITFPDPQLRFSKMKKRLTHPRFLRLYKAILAPGGTIHLKTDSPDLYGFTKQVIDLFGLELLQDRDDVYSSEVSSELAIKTHYESLDIAQSNRVHYLQFRINKALPEAADKQLKDLLSEQPID